MDGQRGAKRKGNSSGNLAAALTMPALRRRVAHKLIFTTESTRCCPVRRRSRRALIVNYRARRQRPEVSAAAMLNDDDIAMSDRVADLLATSLAPLASH